MREKKVAVDTYSWLYKGGFSCSKELCVGIPTTRHIEYCMSRIQILKSNKVIPVLVFDGGDLPMKDGQETKRNRSRKENLAKAAEHEKAGNMKSAYECYQRALDITPEIAHQLIQVLKQEEIEFIVAPYEADAQIAYLCNQGYVHAVISEDSDLIAYACSKVLFKMDKFGNGMQISYSDLHLNADLKLANFTKQMIIEMCIFSGCDYLTSISGMGLKKAHGIVQRFRNYQKAIKYLRFNGVSIPEAYEDSFSRALKTFLHQRVYDPVKKCLVHLEPIPHEGQGQPLDFLGPSHPPEVAEAIATGTVNPVTLKPYTVQRPSSLDDARHKRGQDVDSQGSQPTVRLAQLKARRRTLELPVQKNKLAKYFVSASTEAKKQFQPPRSTPPLDEDLPTPSGDLSMFNDFLRNSHEDHQLHSPVLSNPSRPNHRRVEVACHGATTRKPSEDLDLDFDLVSAHPSLTASPSSFRVVNRCVVARETSVMFCKEGEELRLTPPETSGKSQLHFRDVTSNLDKEDLRRALRDVSDLDRVKMPGNPFVSFQRHHSMALSPKESSMTSPELIEEPERVARAMQRPLKRKIVSTSSFFSKVHKTSPTDTFSRFALDVVADIVAERGEEHEELTGNDSNSKKVPTNLLQTEQLIGSHEQFSTDISYIPRYANVGHEAMQSFTLKISPFNRENSTVGSMKLSASKKPVVSLGAGTLDAFVFRKVRK